MPGRCPACLPHRGRGAARRHLYKPHCVAGPGAGPAAGAAPMQPQKRNSKPKPHPARRPPHGSPVRLPAARAMRRRSEQLPRPRDCRSASFMPRRVPLAPSSKLPPPSPNRNYGDCRERRFAASITASFPSLPVAQPGKPLARESLRLFLPSTFQRQRAAPGNRVARPDGQHGQRKAGNGTGVPSQDGRCWQKRAASIVPACRTARSQPGEQWGRL